MNILALYEHKARELDSLIVLKSFLKDNKCIIGDTAFTKRKSLLSTIPEILILPFLHSILDWKYFVTPVEKIIKGTPLVVNLHWEQLGTANSQSFLAPKDTLTRDVYHVSWSEDFTEFLVNEGSVDPRLVWQIGNPRADLLSLEFRNCYISDEQLKRILFIPKESPFYLFIMSFSGAFLQENYIRNVEKKGGYDNFRNVVKITSESLELCIEEIKKLAQMLRHEGSYLLLRPHPMTPIKEILKRVSEMENIRVSREQPLHEIIYHSHGVISWLSTGTIDAYLFNKPTVILRPKKIPKEYDFKMFEGFKEASNASEMYHSLLQKPEFVKSILERYVRTIYGSLDGRNTFRLAKKILSLQEKVMTESKVRIRKNSDWWLQFSEYILRDIPKNLLAKYVPSLLPKEFQGRLDDKYSKSLEICTENKYSKIPAIQI
jgi:surface carbohydrate biosynthesis protein